MTVVLLGVLGGGVAVGALLIVAGLRGRPARVVTSSRLNTWLIARHDRKQVGLLVVAVLAGLAVGVVTGWVVGGILAMVALLGLPRILGSNADHRRQLERIEAIAGWTEMLRDTLVAAAGLEQAILATAPACPEAIREEITELAVRLERGDRLAPSLRHLADQLRDPTADLVISALVLAAEHQARQLADLLGELAGEAREQASMRMRVEAGRARTRTSVRVVVITTLVFAAGLVLLNRGYLAPYDSAFGQIMLLLVGLLFTVAFTWLGRIVRQRAPERFLTELNAIRQHDADVDVLLAGKGASS
ncbi:type II secretion system F family protein [Amycolatopsis sp. SID8362]|uniref:type II secretion system F family protein n=1 Tax=Amycolatopsis sp. SID8362 TaxID=2690346 RepID=UPI001371A43F|nr:type II secretion system F family protein [Amycolatopsis sp. SID8362]NBH04564.1 pilus assembly protein TadB [Amycolatopsis sp. SID8362]NED41263.1 pilus assembly protein TadB [Amycolatopsis sp. SID8362]